ncbi:uroporphyrinogen-III C-methyltransferase [Ramlibacter pallidus]|uniref:Uroporphyrinogen-III C-methyltransferase n=1 Tax=Ramlibacter pallidus TaxID=2780087 RepID=A0ABR9S870_9BURK|nr:uroporphyrinogen-III C-methyltransferase [Ramlibacter pallidus]MBE7369718.1 uroporphyrinogen-III C-methyltransferase [Ramlibacter pallidus]
MSSQPPPPTPELAPALPAAAPLPASVETPVRAATVSRATLLVLGLLASAALLSSLMLWQRLSTIQEQLARQSADTGANAIEARALARQAQDIARDAVARQAVLEARLSEVALQRTQLEDLMQSLSRTRDENLVVEIESALRLAQQQAQLTGSSEPLLAALRTADHRLSRAALPRLARVRTAITRDIDRIRSAAVTDVPSLLARLDEVVRQVDELPLANAVPLRTQAPAARPAPATPVSPARMWWESWRDAVTGELRALVRVSRIEEPDAVLVVPEQAFFLRENLKLKLLNARLSLLARQNESARADVAGASAAVQKYFDMGSRRTQGVLQQLQQVQTQVRAAELPRVDETLAVLATVAGGK